MKGLVSLLSLFLLFVFIMGIAWAVELSSGVCSFYANVNSLMILFTVFFLVDGSEIGPALKDWLEVLGY